MIVYVCSFTEQGLLCEKELSRRLPELSFVSWKSVRNGKAVVQESCPAEEQSSCAGKAAKDFVGEAFRKHLPLIFVGATGIAVRMIAAYVKDKFLDSPVVVMDEKARFVIPLLSGHMGGANELAQLIAERLNSLPVITTASDVEGKFSVDVFAQRNGFSIVNREVVKEVTGKILSGSPAEVWIHPQVKYTTGGLPPELLLCEEDRSSEGQGRSSECGCHPTEGQCYPPEMADIIILPEESGAGEAPYRNHGLVLRPRLYCLGIGCKRGKSFEELSAFLENHIPEHMLKNIYAIASIDLKKDEQGLMELAQYYHVPFLTYSAEELSELAGNFSESEFVKEKTGVSNVCERAAVKCAGSQADLLPDGSWSSLIVGKKAFDGMTLAVAKRSASIVTWDTCPEGGALWKK